MAAAVKEPCKPAAKSDKMLESMGGEIDRYYLPLHKLGEGTYGVVYSAQERTTGRTVAIKKIKLANEANGVPPTSLREIAVLKELEHINIVRLHHVMYHDGNQLYLVFEYLEHDLKHFMQQSDAPLSASVVQSYMFQLLSGIRFCHSRRIIHRDLKPMNLLINHKGHLKIADFGLARCFGLPMRNFTHEVVTLWYRAPEVLLGSKNYSIAIDMWSIGCIFAEMVNRYPLFDGGGEIDQLFKIFTVLGTPDENVWPDIEKLPDWKAIFPQWKKVDLETKVPALDRFGVDLLAQMLVLFPGRRLTACRALRHPYFADLDPSQYIEQAPRED